MTVKRPSRRPVPVSANPKPTDGLYRDVRVEFTNGDINPFVARWDTLEAWWLCLDGSVVWPTDWATDPLAEQPDCAKGAQPATPRRSACVSE